MAVKKMVMTPYDEEEANNQSNIQDGGGDAAAQTEQANTPFSSTQPRNKIKAHAQDRQKKLIAIILKLARVNGYNDYGEIRSIDGKYRHDIVPLLAYALSRDTGVKGLDDFIHLLKEADISSDLILNGYLRSKLNEQPTTSRHQTTEKPTSVSQQPPELVHIDDNAVDDSGNDGANVALPETDDSDLNDDGGLMDDDYRGRKRKRAADPPTLPPPPKLVHHSDMPRVYKKLKEVGWESKDD